MNKNQNKVNYNGRQDESLPLILCLSHLHWDHVWQRPQQILSRVAQTYPVVYVSEPKIDQSSEGEPHLHLIADEGNLTAWCPVFPNRAEVLDAKDEIYVDLVKDLLLEHGITGNAFRSERQLITWFYTPIPHFFLDHLSTDLVVYDVMDELANFKGSARELPQREASLLRQSDVVFTGGRSLYEARKNRHPNVHLFASGVEPDHFALALDPATEIATEVADLNHPVIGYYGVIDERIDYVLLDEVAARRPEWSVVMVGPFCKVEEKDLPRRANILYTGQQPYSRLPNFLKGFDVCMMPFAMNDATRFISPTKTLEYMAAHKPIVSTPVPDVVRNWGDVVRIASGADEFIAAVEKTFEETGAERAARAERENFYVSQNTWNYIASSMLSLIDEAFAARLVPAAQETAVAAKVAGR